jgi:hypothetical protein
MKNLSFRNSKGTGPKPRISLVVLATIVGLVGFASGCVFVPTPHYYATGSRHNVTKQSTNLFRPGADTIENVMLKLGEPDRASQDERKITYRSKMIVGFIISTAEIDPNGEGFPINHYLTIKFDCEGVVTNLEYSTYLGWDLGRIPN